VIASPGVPPPGTYATAASLAVADGRGPGDKGVTAGTEGNVVGAAASCDGDGVGLGVAPSLGLGRAESGDGGGVGRGVGVAVGRVVALGAAVAVARGVGAGVGLAVGLGVGSGVGFGVGAGVGGSVIVTEPAARLSLNRSRPIASNVAAWVPAGSLPDHWKRTPCFQFVPEVLMRCVAPATRTRTQSAGDPSRLRYVTEKAIVVSVVPLPGDADPFDSFVGPAAAEAGAASARTTIRAIHHAPSAVRRRA
jgi:hypothetical protein